jgi:hypothetical protein
MFGAGARSSSTQTVDIQQREQDFWLTPAPKHCHHPVPAVLLLEGLLVAVKSIFTRSNKLSCSTTTRQND